ncbi:MAG: VanZ family protein [Clostridia bacterium]|nr:VanZ family protein [Clostridia bacterium]
MGIKTKWILRAATTALCVFAVGFILYNSVQPAVESAAQSSRIVEMVQRAVAVFAPHSSIVTATGEEYRRLHEVIRTLAHFSEYALLGALGGWCCLSYTRQKSFYAIPMVGLTAVAVLDECLQHFTPGRSMQWVDLLVDVGGGACGFAFSLLLVWLVVKIKKRRKYETG